jgi:hypothetical protein
MPCSPLKVNLNFGGTFASIFILEEKAKQETSVKYVASRAHVCFLLGL